MTNLNHDVLLQNVYYTQGLVPPVRLSITSFIMCIFSIGMALGVFFALSFLLYIQVIIVVFSLWNCAMFLNVYTCTAIKLGIIHSILG